MEIVGKNQSSAIGAYVNQVQMKQKIEAENEQAARQPSIPSDTVVISDTAKRVQDAQTQLRQIPDVRADKVAEIKARIRDGKYEIDADAIADKMIRESLTNDLLK